jgi:hypothetical protein
MPHIIVTPLSRLAEIAESHNAGRVLTLINAATKVERPKNIAHDQYLFLGFNDITEPKEGLVSPAQTHVHEIKLVHWWCIVMRAFRAQRRGPIFRRCISIQILTKGRWHKNYAAVRHLLRQICCWFRWPTTYLAVRGVWLTRSNRSGAAQIVLKMFRLFCH